MPRPPSPARQLVRLLESAAAPLYALDGRRQIIFANNAVSQWLGIHAEKLIGRRCDFHSGGDDPIAAACAGLCPPPEAFSGEVSDGFVSRLASGDQPFDRRPAHFLRLAVETASDFLLIITVAPATVGS